MLGVCAIFITPACDEGGLYLGLNLPLFLLDGVLGEEPVSFDKQSVNLCLVDDTALLDT
jgi:hypothetical protein